MPSLRGTFHAALMEHYLNELDTGGYANGHLTVVVGPGRSIELVASPTGLLQATCLLNGERVGVLSDWPGDLANLLDRCTARLAYAVENRETRQPDDEQVD